MKILSIETSGKICSVAILEDKQLLKKIELNTGLTHSETLMPLIKQILEETHLALSDIQLLVCDVGPGSFTGLRIGVATVKAFSDSLHIPSVGISSLEGLAYSIKKDGLICSLIDCKNDNCYYALYQLKNTVYTVLEPPKADSITNCLNYLKYKYNHSTITFIGDGCSFYKEHITTISSNFIICDVKNFDIVDVYLLGLAGRNSYTQFGITKPLLPLYLKKPQAQRQLEEKNIMINNMNISDLENFEIKQFDDFWNIDILKDELTRKNSEFICAKLENTIIGFARNKNYFR